jgi:hypothetical protein
MMRVLVLAEGQTEETFVKQLLAPSYENVGLYLLPTVLVTKVVKDGPQFKGGVSRFSKFEGDLRRLLKGAGGGAQVTTMIDYYGLPDDFPGMSTRPTGTPEERVRHVENAVHLHFGSPANFIPFFTLHEFEALLFSTDAQLPIVLTAPEKSNDVTDLCSAFPNPETINEGRATAPSKRIEAIFPAYKKVLHGPLVASAIGLTAIRARCPHFDKWLQRIDALRPLC